jgi:hypothetical protein
MTSHANLLTMVFLFLLPACSSFAVWSAPEKRAQPATSAEAKMANSRFWNALHGGHYDAIPEVIEGLQAVYLANPNDPETTAHLGFAHIWRLSESARLARLSPTITDEIVLSRRYFEEAVQLSPNDARFLGFSGATMVAEGTLHSDEKLKRRGYYRLKDAVTAWPEFNLFTMGYSLSRLPPDDRRYHEALEQQWETLDLCAEERIDRKNPDYSRYMNKETTQGKKRACWNTWIAPHNFEGFFLNMGDMLVKQGDIETAKKIYAAAKLSSTYSTWAYRQTLEDRIADVDTNIQKFRTQLRGEKTQTMMIASAFACTGCHQQ